MYDPVVDFLGLTGDLDAFNGSFDEGAIAVVCALGGFYSCFANVGFLVDIHLCTIALTSQGLAKSYPIPKTLDLKYP